jgi:hypothetical protein
VFRRLAYVLVALAGCKDPNSKATEPAPASPIVIKDAGGAVVGELKPTRPCRATIGPLEMIIGGPPLVATLGSTKWTGLDEGTAANSNGTMLMRDAERIARVFPVGDPASGAVLDTQGVAKVRVKVTGKVASLEDGSAIPIRKLTLSDDKITADSPALTITGTQDLVLAALFSAPELLPEVRMLAACERVLLKGPK